MKNEHARFGRTKGSLRISGGLSFIALFVASIGPPLRAQTPAPASGRLDAGVSQLPGEASVVVDTVTEPKSGLQFVKLPGGTFHRGCEPQDGKCADAEKPGRDASVSPIWMGKTEVTVQAYRRCVDAGVCSAPGAEAACTWSMTGKANYPVNCVAWSQAAEFCKWIGGRLPTSDEWEYAAKGGESRIYPWGNRRPDATRACYRREEAGTLEPADSHPAGASKHGLLNLAGGVWEWMSSTCTKYPDMKEMRGGSCGFDALTLRASYVDCNEPKWGLHDGEGIRCVMDVSAVPAAWPVHPESIAVRADDLKYDGPTHQELEVLARNAEEALRKHDLAGARKFIAPCLEADRSFEPCKRASDRATQIEIDGMLAEAKKLIRSKKYDAARSLAVECAPFDKRCEKLKDDIDRRISGR